MFNNRERSMVCKEEKEKAARAVAGLGGWRVMGTKGQETEAQTGHGPGGLTITQIKDGNVLEALTERGLRRRED